MFRWMSKSNLNGMNKFSPGIPSKSSGCGLLLVLMMTACLSGCGGPVQVASDEECLKTVDALWTAVTSRRADLLRQTADNLHRLERSGQLPSGAHDQLNEIVREAESGEWPSAAQNLKWFMSGQRRAG